MKHDREAWRKKQQKWKDWWKENVPVYRDSDFGYQISGHIKRSLLHQIKIRIS